MSTDVEKQTEAVFSHHMRAYLARDLDDILSDYTEDSAVIVNLSPVPLKGLAAIRGMFTQVMEMASPAVMAEFRVSQQVIDGQVAYLTWSAGKSFPFVTDTFVIRDGKIAIQTAAAYLPGGG